MSLIYLVIVFIFGTLIGSFINVVGLRYNSGLSVVNGRSKCFHCDTPLKWYEMVPVFSFLFLSGRCRTCKNKLSWQYPLIEFVSGIVFVGILVRQINLWSVYSSFENGLLYSVLFCIYYCIVFSILFVITIYDFRHKIIPNFFVYLFILFSAFKLLLFAYIKYPDFVREDFFDLLSPLILFGAFYLLWAVSKGRWIGFGDVKLVFGIGALLGFVYGVGAIVLGFWIGAAWSVGLLFYSHFINKDGSVGMKSELPFAPFLIAGTIIVFICRLDVLGLSSFFGS